MDYEVYQAIKARRPITGPIGPTSSRTQEEDTEMATNSQITRPENIESYGWE